MPGIFRQTEQAGKTLFKQGAVYVLLSGGAFVLLLPLFYMISTAFKPFTYIFEIPPQFFPKEPTVDNFVRAWTSNYFAHYFANSLLVAAATTVLSAALSSMLAFPFARFRFPGREALFAILLVPMMIPSMVLIIPQFILAKSLGLLNSLWGLILVYTVGNIPFFTFMLRAFFAEIPRELEEAVYLDGGNKWTIFSRIVLPLSTPGLATIFIFAFMGAWDEFTWALTIINDPLKRTLPIAIRLFQSQHATQWGLVFAASLIAMVPMVAIFLTFQRYFVKGLQAGAIKG